jgi:heme-degrading monooxygenase HmoA
MLPENAPHRIPTAFRTAPVPGFVEFHLLKGPEAEDHTLYASHTVWENRAVFEAWTKSEAFRAAHSGAGGQQAAVSGSSAV